MALDLELCCQRRASVAGRGSRRCRRRRGGLRRLPGGRLSWESQPVAASRGAARRNVMTGIPATLDGLSARVQAAIGTVAGWDPGRRAKEAEACADLIASGADLLRADVRASAGAGVTAGKVGEALATGLAILAYRPGGAVFAGMRWDAAARDVQDPIPGLSTISGPAPGSGRGVVFTPRSLAEEVTGAALDVITDGQQADRIESLRVADIACGSGVFLAAAARYLGGKLAAAWDEPQRAWYCEAYGTADPVMAARALVISHCLYGVDLDPLSVELAAVTLQLLAPAVRLPDRRPRGLRCGDALAGWGRAAAPPDRIPAGAARFDWPTAFGLFRDAADPYAGFDAVIGNPPFLGGNLINGEAGAVYREYLIRSIAGGKRGRADLAVYFWLRAHELASADGVVAIIGPSSLLLGSNVTVGRDQLARRGWRPYRLHPVMTWPAANAKVSVCVVWTHRLAAVPGAVRSVPEGPPIGEYAGTVDIHGTAVRLYRHTPALQARPDEIRAAEWAWAAAEEARRSAVTGGRE